MNVPLPTPNLSNQVKQKPKKLKKQAEINVSEQQREGWRERYNWAKYEGFLKRVGYRLVQRAEGS